jgi:phage/plasmid-associated DNA primase
MRSEIENGFRPGMAEPVQTSTNTHEISLSNSTPKTIDFQPTDWDHRLTPEHRAELDKSVISPENQRFFESADGDEATEFLVGDKLAALPGDASQYATKPVQRILAIYPGAPDGGLIITGLDPLNDFRPMQWGQIKLNTPRPDSKYEQQLGQIARSFVFGNPEAWRAAEQAPSPLYDLGEGGKKTACLASLNLLAIGLPGIDMGTRKNEAREHELIPDLAKLARPGVTFRIGFDQDKKPKTRKKVSAAIDRIAAVLYERGCNVLVVSWDPKLGKGIDDVAYNHGTERVLEILEDAIPWEPPAKNYAQIVEELLFGGDWFSRNDTLYQRSSTGTHYEKRPDCVELRRIADFGATYRTERGFVNATAKATAAALDWVKQRKSVAPDTINPPGALNLINGVLVLDWGSDLPQWRLVPHGAAHIFTYAPTYAYNPAADPTDCDRLLSALDPEQLKIWLKTMAASLDLPQVRKLKGRLVRALILWGAGANGKDTLRDAVAEILGGQGMSSCSLNDFSQYDSGRKFGLAALEHSRINWSSENANTAAIDKIESLKIAITGDRSLTIERKNEQGYDVAPACICVFNTNGIPNLNASTEAISSRIAVLKFDKTFRQGADPSRGEIEADPRLKYDPEFVQKNILPALLNRLLASLQDLIRDGIDYFPTANTLSEIREHNSHLTKFCSDVGLVADPDSSVSVSALYNCLENWYTGDGTLTFDASGKPVWTSATAMGDRLVKAPNQVVARFLELFPHVKKAVRARTGAGQNSNKPEPILVGLRLPTEPIELVPDTEITPPLSAEITPETAQTPIVHLSQKLNISHPVGVAPVVLEPEQIQVIATEIEAPILMPDEGVDEW